MKMKEAYISFELAKLLKEKGFDWETQYVYTEDGTGSMPPKMGGWRAKSNIPMATHQMVCAWLREKHQLHIIVGVSPLYGKVKDKKGRNTCGLLYWHYTASGEWVNEKYNPFQKAFVVSGRSNEEAIEEALKYSLKNLI